MEKSMNSFRLNGDHNHLEEDSEGFKCSGCGEEFRNPLLATVSSNVSVRRYYACPRCLSKVDIVEKQRSEEIRESQYHTKEAKRVAAKLEENATCNHFMGYLKKRPRDSPFPEECLTCNKMIECLVH